MSNRLFEEIVELWQADKRQYVKKSTYSAYSLLITNHLLPAFSGKKEITEALVQEMVFDKLECGLSRKSVRDILVVLKMILRFGVKNGYTSYHEIEVKFPTERVRPEIEVLSRSDQKKVMDHIRSNLSFMNLGIYVCLSAGLRIGEVCALTWEDLDVDRGVIRVSKTIQRIYVVEDGHRHTELLIGTPKSANSAREVPMARNLAQMVRPLRKVVDSRAYVLTNSAHPTEPRTYRNYYKRFMAQLGLPPLRFHGLRHSFATRCIESKCDYKTVSVLLGHSSISTTLNLYVHPNMEQKQRCIDQMFRSLK